jgi:uncharacterized membrane protein
MTLPFAFFGFWATTLAVGLAAAAVPIIIHLLNRRRYQVVVWAAMRFLLNAQKKNVRRMRLEQLILLLLRVAILVLLVVAMASVMPWAENVWAFLLPESAGFLKNTAGRTHRVLVLDASLSMAARHGGGKTSFDLARDLAGQIVHESQPGDAFSVLLLKDRPEWAVRQVSYNSRDVLKGIDDARQAHGNAAVADALKEVAEKLAESGRGFKYRQVYFLTDLQKATWLPGNISGRGGLEQGNQAVIQRYLQEIQRRAQTVFIDVHKDNPQNLTVTDLALDASLITTGREVPVVATVQHYGLAPIKNLPVELLVGRARGQQGEAPFQMNVVRKTFVPIKPGERITVPLPYKFTTPGTYAVQVRIGADDLEADNSRTVVVTVKDTVPVLLVNGRKVRDEEEKRKETNPFIVTATEFLQAALNPEDGGPRGAAGPVQTNVVSAEDFENLSEINLAGYDCIYLCDVAGKQLSTNQVRRLQTHLRRGGGLVISMGDTASEQLKEYNELFHRKSAELLPARLTAVEEAPAKHWFIPRVDKEDEAFQLPPLKAFNDSQDRGALLHVQVKKYVRAQVDPAARTILGITPQAETNAELPKGRVLPLNDPLLLEWNPPQAPDAEAAAPANDASRRGEKLRYRGRVILMTSTWNRDWTTWPLSPTFGSMTQELLRLAIAGRLREHAVLVGEHLEEVLLSNGTTLNVQLHLPEGASRQLTTAGQGEVTVFHWSYTDQSGIYRMAPNQGSRDYLFAVNVPSTVPGHKDSESDLTPVTRLELEKAYPRWQFQVARSPRDVKFQAPPGSEEEEVLQGKFGPEMARSILLLVLLLIVLEVVLACLFGHFATVPGAVSPKARNVLWPAAVAVAAGSTFVVLALVLTHAAWSGDFLGFLPSMVRGWIEALCGIAPAPAGETPKWEPVFTPYLPFLTDPGLEWTLAGLFLAGAIVGLFFLYRSEARAVAAAPKVLMAGLVVFVLFLMLYVLLPQFQVNIRRESWPDLIVLIDDSLSMGVADQYQEEAVAKAAARLAEHVKKQLLEQLPEHVTKVRQTVEAKRNALPPGDEAAAAELKGLEKRLNALETQLTQLNSTAWSPNRLQLAQALMHNDQQDWLKLMLENRKMKVHVYHLDARGKALKLTDSQGRPIALTGTGDGPPLEQAHEAIAQLEPYATESQLGTAVRQVLDHFGGSSVSAVVLLTDGNTTSSEDRSGHEKDLAEVAKHVARSKGVPLFLVGIGDDSELRDLRLENLQVIDTVYVNDRVIFEAAVIGKGYKNLTVRVVLKVRESDGTETEVDSQKIKVDPDGKTVPIQLKHVPTKAGEKVYIVEVIPPKGEKDDKLTDNPNLRQQRTIFVQEAKPIKILLVEGGPRYEYRFLKTLLEREKKDARGNQSLELKVVLTDADPNIPKDEVMLPEFPFNKAELEQYDVVILGDVDPNSTKLGPQRLANLADTVRKKGGGLLMLAGPLYNPHAYRNTPLAEVLPVEADKDAPRGPAEWNEGYRLDLTPAGSLHPMFRLTPNQADNAEIWQKLSPMFWHSSGYKLRAGADVLATHPRVAAGQGLEGRLPLVAQQRVGAGRCTFFGFDESWRWRFREDEFYYNRFWIGAMRYLSPSRVRHTKLLLDSQTPYRQGDKIKVTVRFPDNLGVSEDANPLKNPGKQKVKVMVKQLPDGKGARGKSDSLELAKVEGSWGTYEGYYPAARKGKYEFWLATPDVKDSQPNKKQPSAEALVILPPGELDKLRMNRQNMEQAAAVTGGGFYTLADAALLPSALPSGYRVLLNSEGEPWVLWNHPALFLLGLGLYTSLWLLRKRYHLL